jgi:hypothetical protein
MHEVQRTRRISYANVTATLALVMAMSTGGAFAAAKIGSSDIAKNAIKSKHIKAGAVQNSDLGANAVTTDKVLDGTLTGADVKDGSLTGGDVTDGSLTGTDIQDNSLTGTDIQDGSVGSNDLGTRAKGVALAGVTMSSGGTISKSFNRLGGAITVTHPATGEYDINIPGGSFSGFVNQISSLEASVSTYCFVNQATGTNVELQCRSLADVAANPVSVSFVLFSDNVGVSRPDGTPPSADGS